MQAVILSAGFGKRLRPLTETMPKVMVPIAGKPLMEHHIKQLRKHGIKEIFINLHYLPEVIKDYFDDGSEFGVKIFYNYEPEILGTAGGIKKFEDKLADHFFVIYGDILSFVDYTKFKKYFDGKSDCLGVGIVGDTDHPYDSDLAEIDSNMHLKKLYRKPHSELPNNYKSMKAVFIFKKEILSYIPENTYYEIDHHLLPDVLSRGLYFYGYESPDYLKDIGTWERYTQVQEDYFKINKIPVPAVRHKKN